MNYQFEVDKQLHISLYLLFFLIGIFLLSLAYKRFLKIRKFLVSGLPVKAKVVKIRIVPGSDDGEDSITHELEFTDKHNNSIRFEDNPAFGAQLWRRGEEISIIYDPENPYYVKVISYWALYWSVIALALPGLSLFTISVGYFSFCLYVVFW